MHPSASPGRSLNEAQSTDVLKQAGGSGRLDGKVSGAGTSTGTSSHQHFGGRDSLRTLHSDMEGSGGQLLGQRSSDLSMPQIGHLGLLRRPGPSRGLHMMHGESLEASFEESLLSLGKAESATPATILV